MRIITGTARGCRLKAPKGQDTRPTADRIKESLFNILGQRIFGRDVLDIFAGTGNLGLEALSRGAASAVFVDQATGSLIKENAVHARLDKNSKVVSGDAFAVLRRLEAGGQSFGVVFCDPPYHKGLWEKALLQLDASSLLSENGILIVEHGADEENLPELKYLLRVRNERYGKTTQLSIFQRRSYVEGSEFA